MSEAPRIAEVIVDLHSPDVDRVFHYAIPPHLRQLTIGHRVLVPFGRQRRVEGYVIGLLDRSEYAPLKEVQALLEEEPLLDPTFIEVARWISARYLCPLVQALQCFIPPGSRFRAKGSVGPKRTRLLRLVDPAEGRRLADELERKAPKQAALIRTLLQTPSIPPARALAAAGATHSSLTALVRRGVILVEEATAHRDPIEHIEARRETIVLNDAQRAALAQITRWLDRGSPKRLLLQGVTGSGKTEVYLRAMLHALKQGRGAILLVPEIALTPQTVTQLRAIFGETVALLHSRLSPGERYDEWQRIFAGEKHVVIGARSAVFAPLRHLGLIIVDEEHEPSYKQEESPRYHAREVAWQRCLRQGALLLLGSATPDVTTRFAAERSESLLVLPQRIEARPLPTIHVVDMRQELHAGNRSIFSRELAQRLAETFHRREQALLFMNRRGYASFVLCRACGYVPRCAACDVSFTFHLPGTLRCHYCEEARAMPQGCPQCGSPYLRPFGGGTQRIEEELRKLFPDVRPVRMDVDTTRRKGAHARMIAAFAAREYDCLIGTQMVAKGLHFPGVTLVGVISADTSLFFPDYRAAERTFQLLTQVAGRAGRGDQPGEVIVQTYAPDHYAVEKAAAQAYESFYAYECSYREKTGYPPFGALVRCLFSGEAEEAVTEAAHEWGRWLSARLPDGEGTEVLGPSPAPLSRLKGRFRWHLLIKGAEENAHRMAKALKDAYDRRSSEVVRLSVDVDPHNLM